MSYCSHELLSSSFEVGMASFGGEIPVTNKLSSESSDDQIQYRTMCETSIM